jgi:hypothetical protein
VAPPARRLGSTVATALAAVLVVSGCGLTGGGTVVSAMRTVATLDDGRPLRDGGQVCVDRKDAAVVLHGCWDVRRLAADADPEHDYMVWFFRGGASPVGRSHLDRVSAQVKLDSDAFVVDWDPNGDLDVPKTETVRREAHQGKEDLGYEFNALKGTIRPDMASHSFQVSWVEAKGGTAAIPGKPVEVGSRTMWAIPEGATTVRAELTLEAEY